MNRKKKLIDGLLKVYSFTDPTATTLDWTSSSPGLFVCEGNLINFLKNIKTAEKVVGVCVLSSFFVFVIVDFNLKNGCGRSYSQIIKISSF